MHSKIVLFNNLAFSLSQENLNLLSGYISSLGYDFMKAKPKEDYEFKYVWLKR